MGKRRDDNCVKRNKKADLRKVFGPVEKVAEMTDSERAYFDQLIKSNNQVKRGDIVIGSRIPL